MSEAIENLRQEIAKLNDTMLAHRESGDMATLDTEKIAGMVQSAVDKTVAEKVAEAERSRVLRKGEIIGPPGFEHVSRGVIERGKFEGKAVDDLIFTEWILRQAHRVRPDAVKLPSKEMTDTLTKALSATGSGTGDEFVPTGMAAQLWQDMFLASKVVNLIGTVPMPTDPFDMPLGWGTITWRKGSSNTATTATDPATAKSTLTATEQIAEVDWSYDLDEDAVIAVLPTLRTEIARSGAEAADAFVVNADATDANTGNINSDDANPADDSYYLSSGQDGLRHLFLVDNTAQDVNVNNTLTDTDMRSGLAKLDKYGSDTSRLAIVTDAVTYVKSIMGLTNVNTVDKFGPQATILTGQLAAYSGVPIIVSASVARTDTDGKYTTTTPASNDVKGTIVMFHRDMWRVGFRRQLLIEVDRLIQKRQLVMVASFRIAVAARGTRSSAQHTAGLRNIT